MIVYIEKNAGAKIGFSDQLYEQAGAKIVDTAAEVYEKAEMEHGCCCLHGIGVRHHSRLYCHRPTTQGDHLCGRPC